MPANEPTQPGWVSQVSIAWAFDDAPCPTDLLPVLLAIARRCNNDGTDSYQSKPTLARKTGKSRDQVDADVKRLLELGLIRLGDQTLPERNGVPAGQRPVVYDVALEVRGPKPSKAGRNKEGKNKGGRGKGEATPGTGTTPGTDTGGGTDTPRTPGMDTSPTPGMDTPQISPSKNPLNNPSSPAVERGTSPRSNMQEKRKTDDPKTRADLAIMTTAVRLAAPYQDDMTVIESRRLASHVVTALAKGWPEQAVADALARDLAGLDSVAAGLIGRMMELAATPVQPDPHRVREAVG
ncbi:helix-turn-helix domain-containing protein [Salinispora arenicola]|uniref:helix-turn-helix domain-containing protein n=1 Tax=Salinispora arenicola TaxID=168697 RepID=UPI00169AF239|nr:helix-turn-helix domain-containing protein [Salinispora arenicola]NIL62660.1 hypothetical protein [Salinispora arenicola]